MVKNGVPVSIRYASDLMSTCSDHVILWDFEIDFDICRIQNSGLDYHVFVWRISLLLTPDILPPLALFNCLN